MQTLVPSHMLAYMYAHAHVLYVERNAWWSEMSDKSPLLVTNDGENGR